MNLKSELQNKLMCRQVLTICTWDKVLFHMLHIIPRLGRVLMLNIQIKFHISPLKQIVVASC